MSVIKKTWQRFLQQPWTSLWARLAISSLLVSFFAVAIIYIKQNTADLDNFQDTTTITAIRNETNSEYTQEIAAMQAHNNSLTSRIKHLSMDNKRLSTTAQKLAQQLDSANTDRAAKVDEARDLQLQLATIDQDLVRRFENVLEQQQVLADLKVECQKDRSKNKKCDNMAVINETLEGLNMQIKFLKDKRDMLLSQLERSISSL